MRLRRLPMQSFSGDWSEVSQRAWAARCEAVGVPGAHPASDEHRAAWNSLCYQLLYMGRGVLVVVRGGRVALFACLHNTAYQAPWAALRGPAGADPVAYCQGAQRRVPPHRRVEIRPDPRSWSLNGPLLDNWVPPKAWGVDDGRVRGMHAVVTAAARHLAPQRTVEFMLNPRDHPQLRCNLHSPHACGDDPGRTPAWREAAVPSVDGLVELLPVLSQYTSDDFLDIPVPPVRAWQEAAAPLARLAAPRLPRAVFRGSATGGVDNQRIALARALRRCPLADVKITGQSTRFRVDSTRVIHAPPALEPCIRGAPLTMDEQCEFAWAFYVEGNAGADRLPALLARRFVVIVLASRAPALVWLRDGTLRPHVHYVPCPSVEEAETVLAWCQGHPGDCERIAEAGHAAWMSHMSREAIEEQYARAMNAPLPPPAPRACARPQKKRPRGENHRGDERGRSAAGGRGLSLAPRGARRAGGLGAACQRRPRHLRRDGRGGRDFGHAGEGGGRR